MLTTGHAKTASQGATKSDGFPDIRQVFIVSFLPDARGLYDRPWNLTRATDDIRN